MAAAAATSSAVSAPFSASHSARNAERPDCAATRASRASAAPLKYASRQPVLPQAQVGP